MVSWTHHHHLLSVLQGYSGRQMCGYTLLSGKVINYKIKHSQKYKNVKVQIKLHEKFSFAITKYIKCSI